MPPKPYTFDAATRDELLEVLRKTACDRQGLILQLEAVVGMYLDQVRLARERTNSPTTSPDRVSLLTKIARLHRSVMLALSELRELDDVEMFSVSNAVRRKDGSSIDLAEWARSTAAIAAQLEPWAGITTTKPRGRGAPPDRARRHLERWVVMALANHHVPLRKSRSGVLANVLRVVLSAAARQDPTRRREGPQEIWHIIQRLEPVAAAAQKTVQAFDSAHRSARRRGSGERSR